MIKVIRILCAILIIMAEISIHASNQPAGKSEWREIETENFRIIYPSEIKSDAIFIANLMETVYKHDTKTLPVKIKKTPVILYNSLSESNGIAAYAPRRSEWYITPSQTQFTGSNHITTVLAVHEYRHIVQFDYGKKNVNKLLYIIGGESGYITPYFLSTPNWFFEGDATLTETLLTDSGRGRLPSFDADMRAQLLSGVKHQYYTALFGSYNNWIPQNSPYLMGYYMCAYTRRHNDAETFGKVIERTSLLPLPLIFSKSMKNITGKNTPDTYDAAMNELEILWSEKLENLKITDAENLHNISGDWTNNYAPQDIGNDEIIVYRYGIEDMYQIVKINSQTKKEEQLVKIGNAETPPSASSRIICWSEYDPDRRWTYTSYSNIYTYDLTARKKRQLTKYSRYFAPAISPDGTKIAVVEYTTGNICSLVIIDSESGNILQSTESPGFIQTPKWSTNGKKIVYCTVDTIRGKNLVEFNAVNGKVRVILPFSHSNISTPASDGEHIYFSADYSGIDNIYAVNIETKNIYQVTSRKFGAYNPSLSGNKILFNDVTAEGSAACVMQNNKSAWKPLSRITDSNIKYYEPLLAQESGKSILPEIAKVQYSDKKYSHIKDSVNIHSWGPSFDFSNNDVGFSLYSQNIMNTLYSEIGYKRNLNENTNSGHLSISYSGLYPVITTDVIYGGRTSTYTEKKEKKYYSWNELSSGLSFTLPFTLSTGYFQRYVNLTTGGRYMKITDIEKVEKNKINNGTFLPYLFGFTFFNGYQWYRDINPVWGQYLTVNYFGTPDKSNFNGKLFSAISMLFFPGILKHHSFYLSGSYEYQNPDDYVFSSLIRFPRGYSFKFMEKLSKGTANYTLPLFYPDYNFIQFLHFKQIFFNAFFDYGYGITGSNNEIYRSFGGEIVNEMFFFDLNFPINVGLRASYILDGKDKNLMIYEIVLGSNINY